MTLMQYVNVYLDVFCILVNLIILTVMHTSEYRKEKLNKVFLWILYGNLLMLVCDLIICLSGDKADMATHLILIVAHVLIFCSGPIVTIGFAYYVVIFLRQKGADSKRLTLAAYAAIIPCVIDILFCLINPFNGMYYTLDTINNAFHRSDFYLLSQLLSFLSIAVITGMIIAYRKKLENREILFLLSYSIFPAIALFMSLVIMGSGVIYYSITLSILMYYIGIQSEQAKQLKQNELEVSEIRINIMLSQIQPHFIYNSLAAIQRLCTKDPKLAEETVKEFTRYLRGNLESLSISKPVSFANELLHLESYLAIEKKRFGERLNIIYDITADNFYLPALTLQPIAENAVRHGITKKEEGGTVTIRTHETETDNIITVVDDGVGYDINEKKQDDRHHIGIENVRCRLSAMCGGTLTVSSKPGNGTTAVITIPKGD